MSGNKVTLGQCVHVPPQIYIDRASKLMKGQIPIFINVYESAFSFRPSGCIDLRNGTSVRRWAMILTFPNDVFSDMFNEIHMLLTK